MVVSRQVLEGVTQTLGQKYLPELIEGVQQVDLLEPAMGKLFWQSQDAEPGLFIILEGKVRLIDRQNNLLISLESWRFFWRNNLVL